AEQIAQAALNAFHRVAVYTCTVRVTTSILAGTMVDRPVSIVGLGEMVNVIFIGEELSPAFHLGGDDGFDRRAAHMLQHFQRDLSSWCVLVCWGAAVYLAPHG